MTMNNKEKKIAILTSGGDAPGMNACIRACVRTAVYHGYKVLGIQRGFAGLLSAEVSDMNARSVADIIHRGGTILLTARCQEMMTAEGQDKAANICKVLGIEALIVVGGNGSLCGAYELAKRGVNIIGVPATIDFDMPYTKYAIGFDTAVNTGMDAVNKIRDTSSSHERCSVIEVMGRHSGSIALWCGLVTGSEEIVVPEKGDVDTDEIIRRVIENRSKGKRHNLVIVAEGASISDPYGDKKPLSPGGSWELAMRIESVTGVESRATILGHLQRGGSPTAVDRKHALIMGHMAVDLIREGQRNQAVGYVGGEYKAIGLQEALDATETYDDSMYQIMRILAI